jgi:uncharacterized membrane protein
MKNESKDLALAAGFGWLCGMRSMSGPAIVGSRVLRNRFVAGALAVGAAGEVIVDKHPKVPNRNTLEPLLARTASGAFTGAAVMVTGAGWSRHARFLRSRRIGWPPNDRETLAAALMGAAVGGAAAFVATHASYHMRRMAAQRTGAPNLALGVAEDAVVYTAGIGLAQQLGRRI